MHGEDTATGIKPYLFAVKDFAGRIGLNRKQIVYYTMEIQYFGVSKCATFILPSAMQFCSSE